MDFMKFYNGVEMPLVGYGVYQVAPEVCERCVSDALRVGYRSIDTAQAYCNEEQVGAAVAKSAVPRNELFITTKVWISNAGCEQAQASIDRSLRKLRTDYVDLLLIHQPFGDYYGTWRAMEQAYKEGKARAIGVSNFAPDRFVDLVACNELPPMVNQIETHVYNQQVATRKLLEDYHVRTMAWAPLAEGLGGLLDDPTLADIGSHHRKSVAQVALRFLVQQGVVVIPKSLHRDRMIENIDLFDFALNDAEMKQIAALDRKTSLFLSFSDPDSILSLIRYDCR